MKLGVSTFSVFGCAALCIMIAFAALAAVQPKQCSPVLGSGIQVLKNNLTVVESDLKGKGYFTAVENNINDIRAALGNAESSYATSKCDEARNFASEAYEKINLVSSYHGTTQTPQTTQTINNVPSKSIIINYAGGIKISVRNTGDEAVEMNTIHTFLDGVKTDCVWDTTVLSPSLVSICTLSEACTGKTVILMGPVNSDSYKC